MSPVKPMPGEKQRDYSKQPLQVGIVGGAGYAAGELLRLLLLHPMVRVSCVVSQSHAGQKIFAAHPDLLGWTDLSFCSEICPDLEVLFLCTGHQQSKRWLRENQVDAETKIIDLSQDFRLKEPDHDFVYGLPELNREKIVQAQRVANPGCFATAILLGLLPLAREGLRGEEIHVTGVTGSTGAGQELSGTSHYSWRNNNLSVYKAFGHQHQSEIIQSLSQFHNESEVALNFVPIRGPFTRGILASTTLRSPLEAEQALDLYQKYYLGHPFALVVEQNPDLKLVVNTNQARIFLQKHGSYLHIVTVIDNLLKGASGQAVQNMNLMFGMDEKSGLLLKAAAF